MDAWMQALKDCEDEDEDIVDKEINIEDKELDLNRERAKVTEGPTQEFGTGLEVQTMIAAEMKTSRSHRNCLLLAEVVEDKLIDTLQVEYDAT